MFEYGFWRWNKSKHGCWRWRRGERRIEERREERRGEEGRRQREGERECVGASSCEHLLVQRKHFEKILDHINHMILKHTSQQYAVQLIELMIL
jgi:hypothetical protein